MCRNCSSVECLKCVQFHNWFRLYQLQNILGRAILHDTLRVENFFGKGQKYFNFRSPAFKEKQVCLAFTPPGTMSVKYVF